MKLTLVIATYNRSSRLLAALDSVARQSADPAEWECVAVDNNSADDTQTAFAAFAARHPQLNLRMVSETRQGLSHARNKGIAESRGEIIAIIDDDEHINADFISAYIDLFANRPDAVAAGGRVIPEYPSGRPQWLSRYTEKPIANPTDWGGQVRLFPHGEIPAGGNMAFRRELLEHYGGFDTSLGRSGRQLTGGEESDLFERLRADGVAFYYVPDAIIWHVIEPDKLTADYFRRLARGTGAGQRRRALLRGRLVHLYIGEAVKWCATLVLGLFYTLSLRPSKALWLLRMRCGITKGIAGR